MRHQFYSSNSFIHKTHLTCCRARSFILLLIAILYFLTIFTFSKRHDGRVCSRHSFWCEAFWTQCSQRFIRRRAILWVFWHHLFQKSVDDGVIYKHEQANYQQNRNDLIVPTHIYQDFLKKHLLLISWHIANAQVAREKISDFALRYSSYSASGAMKSHVPTIPFRWRRGSWRWSITISTSRI